MSWMPSPVTKATAGAQNDGGSTLSTSHQPVHRDCYDVLVDRGRNGYRGAKRVPEATRPI